MATSNLTQRPQETDTTESEKKRIPGLEDLLHDPNVYADRDRANCAATNALDPINQGFHAIGDLLWRAAQHDGGHFDDNTLHGLGVLLMHMAEFQAQLVWIESQTRERA